MKRRSDTPIEVIDLTVPRKQRPLVQSTLQMTVRGPAVVKPPPTPRHKREQWFTEALQQRMREAVQPQLDLFLAEQDTPLCAFNAEHDTTRLRVAYKDKYYEQLCEEFLQSRGDEEPPQSQDSFIDFWVTWHKYDAHLRLLCPQCYRSVHPQYVCDTRHKPSERKKTVTQTLGPYSGERNDTPHQWLQLASWERTEKGNYHRLLGSTRFTLFQWRDGTWKWVYRNKYSEQHYSSVREALRASYSEFRETILQCV